MQNNAKIMKTCYFEEYQVITQYFLNLDFIEYYIFSLILDKEGALYEFSSSLSVKTPSYLLDFHYAHPN